MASDLLFPSSAALTEIAQQKMPRLTADRPVFDFFPQRSVDDYLVMWEQRDNFTGLQQVRGLNGDPPRVNLLGARRYMYQPGVYGEHKMLDEFIITTRRQYGSFNAPVDVADLVTGAQDHLLVRERDRIESILWTLLTTGTFSVAGPNGAILETDTFAIQTYTSVVTWTTSATATPLADLRAIQLLNRGYSVNFGATSKLYVNRVTANRLLANTNANDVAGRRTGGFGTFNSIQELNTLFTMDDLPNIVVYDEGYQAEVAGVYNPSTGTATSGTSVPLGNFVPFIPNGVGVLVGQRPAGQVVGEYLMTRNASNPGLAPGSYTRVVDKRDYQPAPAVIEIHQGHNGGPALYFPSAIVACTFG